MGSLLGHAGTHMPVFAAKEALFNHTAWALPVPNARTLQALLHSTRAQPEQTWIKAEQPVLSSVELTVKG